MLPDELETFHAMLAKLPPSCQINSLMASIVDQDSSAMAVVYTLATVVGRMGGYLEQEDRARVAARLIAEARELSPGIGIDSRVWH